MRLKKKFVPQKFYTPLPGFLSFLSLDIGNENHIGVLVINLCHNSPNCVAIVLHASTKAVAKNVFIQKYRFLKSIFKLLYCTLYDKKHMNGIYKQSTSTCLSAIMFHAKTCQTLYTYTNKTMVL
jgi:hypothetical protein